MNNLKLTWGNFWKNMATVGVSIALIISLRWLCQVNSWSAPIDVRIALPDPNGSALDARNFAVQYGYWIAAFSLGILARSAFQKAD